MIKRIVVAGCRNYENYTQAKEYIDFCISEIRKKYTLIFLSGGCSVADMLGERYANENGRKSRLCYMLLGWQKQRHCVND